MKINCLYNKDLEIFEKKVIEMKEIGKKVEVDIFDNCSNRTKFDYYIIISDDEQEIVNLKNKVKNLDKLIIITSNLDTKHILFCINITKKISYIGTKSEQILSRVKKYVEKN